MKTQIQAETIFGMYFTLLAGGIVTRKQLAVKYEISTRTVSRYVDALTLSGVPILTQSGRGGGFRLPNDYRLESGYLTGEERARIVACLKATEAGYTDSLNDRIEEKFAALSRGECSHYLINSETLVIDAGAWHAPHVFRGKIETLTAAIDARETVRFTYVDRREKSTERTFDPYCVVLKGGLWYVYGYCRLREDFRLFKLARIKKLESTGSAFERKESNVYEKLTGSFDGEPQTRFAIEFGESALPDVEEWLGTEAVKEEQFGRYTARGVMPGGKLLVSKLMSFGAAVRVLSPFSLKRKIADECKMMLSQTQSH